MRVLDPLTQRDFPLLAHTLSGKRVIYLDSAATSLRPKAVLDAMAYYNAEVGANIHRG
jgi:cysteine desulfurase/selenocysteine lyase